MGSYSSFVSEDIKIVDKEGLRIFLKDIINKRIPAYYHKATKKESKGTYYEGGIRDNIYYVTEGMGLTNDDEIDKAIDKDEISFTGFDEWKIISYWYEDMCMFFRDIAVFIDGEIVWDFENNSEGGFVTFENGVCILHHGEMTWNEGRIDKECKAMPKMPKHVFMSLGLRRL